MWTERSKVQNISLVEPFIFPPKLKDRRQAQGLSLIIREIPGDVDYRVFQ